MVKLSLPFGNKRSRGLQDSALNAITCIRYTMTWRCNFKCRSCNIWNLPAGAGDELQVDEIDRLTRHPLLQEVDEVILSGGEPILRDDFPDIVIAMHRNLKKAKFSITLNGYDPARTESFFQTIRESAPKLEWVLIGVSLNGPKEVHDESRGIPGSFEKAVETARRLKSYSRHVDFSFTFLRDNVEYFDWVNDFAKSLGLGVHICWTVMNDRFRTTEEDLVFQNNPDLIPVLERYCRVDRIKYSGDPLKDFLKYKSVIRNCYLYDSIINRRIMPCHACRTFFHLAPNGDIYPCNFKLSDDRKMGNIRERDFGNVWKNVPPALFKEIETGSCMYPNGVCGDSDINRSLRQADTPIYRWFVEKRNKGRKLIALED